MRRFILFAFLLFYSPQFAAFAQSSTPLSTAAAAAGYGQKIQVAGIHNAGKIDERLFRGAQPPVAALAELKALGVTTIVDLRAGAAATRKREKAAAEKLGMHFLAIPVGGFSTPTSAQVAQFLALFRGRSPEKVFVHCHYGDDRTGVFVASYRMAFDRWSPQQALDEMNFFGFNRLFHPAMRRYVRDFPALLGAAPALAPFRTPAPGRTATPPQP